MRVSLKRIAGPLALLVLFVAGDIVPAEAQLARTQSEERARNRLQRLERELEDLQRYVYNNPAPAAPQSEDAGILGAAADSTNISSLPATALLNERVGNLAEAVRTLTGEVEELSYRTNQLSQRLERVMADFDYRLRALEGNTEPSPYGPMAGAAPSDGFAANAAPLARSEIDVGFQAVPQGASVMGSGMAGAGAPRSLGAVSASRLSGSEEADFEIGMQLLRQGDFDGAQATFQDFVMGYPESNRLGEAHFWLGESLYVRGLYGDAATAYLTSARDHGDGEKAPDSLLKLGMSLAALGQSDQACGAFDQVTRSYPNASDRVTRNVARERAANSCN